MAKRYQIDLVVSAVSTQATVKAVIQDFTRMEGSIAKFGTTFENLIGKMSQGIGGFAVAANQSMASFQATAVSAATASAASHDKAVKQQIIGLDTLRVSGIKAVESQRIAQEKAADAATKLAEKTARANQASIDKSIKDYEKFATQGMISLGSLQMSGVKAMNKIQDAQDKLANKSAKDLDKALMTNMVSLQSLQVSGVNAMNSIKDAQSQATEKVEHHSYSVVGAFAKYASFRAAYSVLTNIGKAWSEITDNALKAAEAAAKYNLTQVPLATQQDKLLKDMVPEQLDRLRNTTVSPEESRVFRLRFQDTAALGIQNKTITQATADELSVLAEQMAGVHQADAGPRGELAGSLSMFGKINSADQGLEKMEATRYALTQGKGDDGPLTRALLSVSGQLVGEGKMVGTIEEMAAILGVQSLTVGPGRSPTETRHLYGFMAGGSPDQNAALEKNFGIDLNKDNMATRLEKTMPKLKAMQDAGKNIDKELYDMGFHDDGERRAAMNNVGMYGAEKERIRMARDHVDDKGNHYTGASLRTKIDDFKASNEGQMVTNNNQKFAAEVLVSQRNIAVANQVKQQDTLSVLNREHESVIQSLGDTAQSYLGFGGREGRLQRRAVSGLMDQMQDNNIPMPAYSAMLTNNTDLMRMMIKELVDHGIKPGQDTANEIARLHLEETKKNGTPANPAPLAAAPVGKGRP